MKILFFAHETTWSGAPIQLLHLVMWLKRKGWGVTVAVPKPATAEAGPISDELARAGVKTIPLLDLSAPPNLGELRALCADYDLVVANTLVMWAPVLAAHAEGMPVVWYIHESLVSQQLMAAIPEIKTALAKANVLVLPTQRTARLYAGLTDRPIEVIPYGIPAARTARVARPVARTRGFLLLGSYEPRKGQDLLLRAIGELDSEIGARGKFTMAGRVLDRAFYDQLVQEAARQPNVELKSAVGHEEALALSAAADVLVCASRDETMPVAILEAMSLGKAIVTTTVGGVSEWLQDGSNALLVPPDDSAALADALRRCLMEPALVASLGEEARRTFIDHFSIDQLGRRFAALFRRVMKQKTR